MQQEYSTQLQMMQEQLAALAKAYLNKVYGWMALSMLVTAGSAIFAMQSDQILTWSQNNQLWLLLGTWLLQHSVAMVHSTFLWAAS